LGLAQDDVKKFIFEPQPPPSGIEIPMEGKAKERREVGEGDDTVVVEDTSDDDDEDEETLQDRFQLRSRFSRPGLPHVPLVQVLMQKVHSAPITQQAEKLASHAQRESDVPVNFS
jgi:hypothetical protein